MPRQSSARNSRITSSLVILAALLVITGWMLVTPGGLFGKTGSIGYAVCHRISERSLHIGDQALPLCARCTGMFFAAVVGLVFQFCSARRASRMPSWQVVVPLALMVAAWIVDGSNSYLYLVKEVHPGAFPGIPNLYVPNNVLRLLTGTGMGLALSAVLFPAFNQTAWIKPGEARALPGLGSFGLLLLLALGLDGLVLTGSPIVLYPLAVISSLGVVILLTIVYSIVWIVIMRQENTFDRFRQLWLAFLAGMTMAMIQVTLIDLLRLWLTGTWGSFPLQ